MAPFHVPLPGQVSLVEEAEMVFSTLSSCGRAVFSRLRRGFELVLIDEAAQVGCLGRAMTSSRVNGSVCRQARLPLINKAARVGGCDGSAPLNVPAAA
jgi:hypothetical protein